jgi:hypothetical protein
VRSRSTAIFTALALGFALGDARAENDDATSTRQGMAEGVERLALTPPTLLRGLVPPPRHVELPDDRARRETRSLSLDLSLSYLRLAVHGDGTPGLSTFLGTSTTSLGGFRLRF